MIVAVDSSDMSPILEKTMEFELIVENGCLQDQMTVTKGIDVSVPDPDGVCSDTNFDD